ncbi:MAG: hypothetical protein IJP03_03705, partial [Christensenellaceae bacterium]|nr:hypothetical protein [Christensenellaceae bacterium]
ATIVGKDGLERSYDLTLQGKDGCRLQLSTADGQYKATVAQVDPVDGQDLILSISADMQQRAYYLMASEVESSQTGVSIVMDGQTGFVEAMVSWPGYDPNAFTGGISATEYEELTREDGQLPLFSRATMGLYPPGSLFKPFTIVPALEEGVISKNTVFPYEVHGNQWQPDDDAWVWPPITRNEKPDGPLDLDTALRFSDNIYFGWVAMRLGEEKFMDYMEKIGIGERMPFDISTAKSNLINDGTEINRKLLTDMSFGQGEVLVTPIQIASYYTAFQNEGDVMQPQMVKEIRANVDGDYTAVETREPTVYKEDIMEPYTLTTVVRSLKNVVLSGTAQSLEMDERTLAAKTGTALKGAEKDQKIAWIVGWWEDHEDCRLALVMIDGPRGVTDHRHRIARALLKP